jgi:magnesium transporter
MALTSGGPVSPVAADGVGPGGIHCVSFHRRDKTSRTFRIEDMERELSDDDVFSWIDVQAPQIAPLNDVLRRLGIDLVLVSHFDAPEILPRIVERSDCLAFYLYEVEDPELHLDTSHGPQEIEVLRMILVLGNDFVLTYHARDLDVVNYVKAQCDESFRLWGKTQGFIAFLFLEKCLYDYAHLNLANDNSLDELQARALSDDRGNLAQHMATAGTNILTLKKLATSLHIVLMLLATKRSNFVSDDARGFYHEMMSGATSVRGAIDSSRDLLDSVIGTIQTEAAKRTGDIARVLTVVSTIILPLTLITGIYGMNFEHMPELKWTRGYFDLLGVLLVIGLTLFATFWHLGWITGKKRPRE